MSDVREGKRGSGAGSLGGADGGDHDGGEFITLPSQVGRPSWGHQPGCSKEVEPVRRLVNLFLDDAEFAHEFGTRPCSPSGPVVRPHGCRTTDELPADHVSPLAARQRFNQPDHSQRECPGCGPSCPAYSCDQTTQIATNRPHIRHPTSRQLSGSAALYLGPAGAGQEDWSC